VNLKCRFNADHVGPFSNAVVLAQHYQAEHPDEYTPKVKVECTVCGKHVGDLAQHMKKMHKTAAVVKVDTEPPAVRWAADHIVLPVVTELAGGKKGALPVNKLAAIFEWRDATQKMLDDVQ